MKSTELRQDRYAAATELGYIFTFLLGVLLLRCSVCGLIK